MPLQADDKVLAFINEPRYIVLATTSSDGTPQQTVLTYTVQDDTILLGSDLNSAKVKNIRRNPRVSLCLEDGSRYVSLTGTAEIIADPDLVRTTGMATLSRYMTPEQMQEMFSRMPPNAMQTRVLIRVKVDKIISWGFEGMGSLQKVEQG